MSIKRVSENQIVKGKSRPDSFYDYLTSRFLAKPLSQLLIALGIKNPNAVTMASFSILAGAAALFILGWDVSLGGRVVIAFLIQLSFTLDCADGQIARVLGKTSLFGAWFDKHLDRIGEMMLYASIGYAVWQKHGSIVYFTMGLFIGFAFSMYTLLFTLRDGAYYEEIKKNDFKIDEPAPEKRHSEKNRPSVIGRKLLNERGVAGVLPYLFFYLNIGIGERYFYPILFSLLGKNDLMLFIVSVLVFLRTSNVFLIQKKKLKAERSQL